MVVAKTVLLLTQQVVFGKITFSKFVENVLELISVCIRGNFAIS